MALPHNIGLSFTHTQDVPSAVWTINHGMGVYPVVDVYLVIDDVQQKIIPSSVTYTNANVCTISFSNEQIGIAVVS